MRTRWFALAAGVLAGLVLGASYAWLVRPVRFADAAPASLRADFRDEYLALIASAYQASGDGARAQARLTLFADIAPEDLTALAARHALVYGADAAVRGLATLAAIGSGPPSPAPAGSATPTPRARQTPLATFPLTVSPFPSAVPFTRVPPAATAIASLRLLTRDEVCDPLVGLRLEVRVRTRSGAPAPGVEVRLRWAGGSDHFFTGLKPAMDAGYGDFAMDPDIDYQVELTGLALPVPGIRAPACLRGGGGVYYGGVRLVFEGQ